MLAATLLALLTTLTLILARAFRGPSVFDRVLAMSLFGSKTVLLIAVGGYALGWTSYADIALFYAMMNFAATIAVLRFVQGQPSEAEDSRG